MPIIRSTKTGRKLVFKSGSPEGSANSTFLSRSKITGRMLFFKGIGVDIDTMIGFNSFQPVWADTNWSKEIAFIVYAIRTGVDKYSIYRSLLKTPKNKILHFCVQYIYNSPFVVDVYALDPNDFEIKEVTWNDQPSFGDFLFSFTPTIDWNEISTGSSGAILLKVHEEHPAEGYYGMQIYSSNYIIDKTKRPYFTDT